MKEDRINYWLDNGAQPTDTVKSLLKQKGINLKRDIAKRKLPEEKAEALLKNWQELKKQLHRKNL